MILYRWSRITNLTLTHYDRQLCFRRQSENRKCAPRRLFMSHFLAFWRKENKVKNQFKELSMSTKNQIRTNFWPKHSQAQSAPHQLYIILFQGYLTRLVLPALLPLPSTIRHWKSAVRLKYIKGFFAKGRRIVIDVTLEEINMVGTKRVYLLANRRYRASQRSCP